MSRGIAFILPCLLCLFPGILWGEGSGWELGMRLGVGARLPGRFDGNLTQFSSTFNPGVASSTNLESRNQSGNVDFFSRISIFPGSKMGLSLGRQDLSPIQLTEYTSDAFYTNLNSTIFSYHALVTYHFHGSLTRNWEWETGLAMGPTVADWLIRGVSGSFGSSRNFFPQEGDLRGVGLAMRGEASLVRKIQDPVYFSFGLQYHFLTVPQFSGRYNGEISSFYISESGRVGVLDETRVSDASFQTNQFLRRLDLNTGTLGLIFSVSVRILD